MPSDMENNSLNPLSKNSFPDRQKDLGNPKFSLNLVMQTESWYRTFFGNLKQIFFNEEKQYKITALPVETQLIREEKIWYKGCWSNFSAAFSRKKTEYQITSKPIHTDALITEIPWYREIFSGLKFLLFKEEVPEIQVTAQPVEVPEIFREYKFKSSSVGLSVVVHVCFVAAIIILPLVFIAGPEITANETELYFVQNTPLILNLPRPQPSGGGGGGGVKAPKPPSKGRLPRPSNRQFTPPTPRFIVPAPLLPVEPTVVVPKLAQLPTIDLPDYGDPLGIPSPPSAGPGSGGGIGTGTGSGVGSGDGTGVGPGKGGGIGGGLYRVGGGVSPPTILSRIEPVYSEEARKAKYQGVVVLSAIVRKDGSIEIVKVIRSLGLGLDENAIAALKRWRFRPGMKGGKPVDVALNIEVNFSLR